MLTFEREYAAVPPGTRSGTGPNDGDIPYHALGFLAWQPHDWHDFQGKHHGVLDPAAFKGKGVPLRNSEVLAVMDGALNANLNKSFDMADLPTSWMILKVEASDAAEQFLNELGLLSDIMDAAGVPKGKCLRWPLNTQYPAGGFKFSHDCRPICHKSGTRCGSRGTCTSCVLKRTALGRAH